MFGGYAYSEGFDRDAGDFIVAVLDSHGVIRSQEKAPRTSSGYLHTAGDPKGSGLVLDNGQNRLIDRVADADVNAGVESWWTANLIHARVSCLYASELEAASIDPETPWTPRTAINRNRITGIYESYRWPRISLQSAET